MQAKIEHDALIVDGQIVTALHDRDRLAELRAELAKIEPSETICAICSQRMRPARWAAQYLLRLDAGDCVCRDCE